MGNFVERSTLFDCTRKYESWTMYVEIICDRRMDPPPSGERCLSINATKLIKRQNVDSSPVRRSLYWTSLYILYLFDTDIDGYDRRWLLALSSRAVARY